MVVKVFTDSTSDIRETGFNVVPLYVSAGGKEYLDGINLTPDEFYRLLIKYKTAKTSQPTPQDFISAWEKVSKEFSVPKKDILTITISDKLSGTYSSACQASEMWGGGLVWNSKTTALPQRFYVEKADKLSNEGMPAEEIVKKLEEMRIGGKVRLYATFADLTYLQRGGRMGKVPALIGGFLNIRPIITINTEGILFPVLKVRGQMSKACDALVDRLPPRQEIARLGVMYAYDKTLLAYLKAKLQEKYPGIEIVVSQLGATLGTYSGPEFYGVVVELK
jgi:DegV family protein with EDD domain